MRFRVACWSGLLVTALIAAGAQARPGAAAALPATAPTVPAPLPALPTPPPAKPAVPQHRARVEFAGRILEVKADNSSLNQILREIERVTGMRITGGVSDERVYGTYGPGETSAVLSALLTGTESNMLLIVDRNDMPTELVLTPRQGGPSPPSPNAGRDDREQEDPDTPPQLSQHIQRAPPPLPQQPPVQSPAQSPQQAPPVTPTAALAPTIPAAAANTTTQQSPNGVSTPQQIYEQLLKLQQQQAKPGVSSPP